MKQNLNGNPEIQNFAQIQYQASSEDLNLKFEFQGSQNLNIRVAISRLDIKIQTQFYHRMLHYLPA